MNKLLAWLACFLCLPVLMPTREIEPDVVALAKKHDLLDQVLFIGRAIQFPDVRRRLRAADPKTHVACLANTPTELRGALGDRHADWVYVRFLPTAEQVAEIHQVGKRVFLAGPNVSGHEPANW